MGKRLAFCISIIALAGCGGAQQSANAIPQAPAALTRAAHSRSWMLPEAKSNDLLYVADGIFNQVSVYSYPKAKPVGTLAGLQSPGGMCPDKDGNVWITNFGANTIVEYAHGGTTPIAALNVPRVSPIACAIDPTSGNLAVGGSPRLGSTPAKVIVYAGATGKPTIYKVRLSTSSLCTYDNDGNLFVYGHGFTGQAMPEYTASSVVELQRGAKGFREIRFSPSGPGYEPRSLQWDGRYLAIGSQPPVLERYEIHQFKAVDKGSVPFYDLHEVGGAWIQGGKVVVLNFGGESGPLAQIYNYPTGGNPIRPVSVPNDSFGLTVSLAPR